MDTIGQRLKALRERADLRQADVGAVLGIDGSAVSRIEAGTRQLNAFEAGLLSQEYHWSPRELLGLPAAPAKLAIAARLRRSGANIAEARERAASIIEVDSLLDEAGAPHGATGVTFTVPFDAPTTADEATKQGEEGAIALRNHSALVGPIVDIARYAERHVGLDVLIEPMGGHCDGLLAVGDACALALVDSSVVSGRQRFTIAHELAHIVLGDATDVIECEDPAALSGASSLIERRADAFASAFLMPEAEFRRIAGPTPGIGQLSDLMVTFGVSWTACKKRCDNLGLTIEQAVAAMDGREVLRSAGYSDDEIVRLESAVDNHMPSRLRQRAQEAFRSGLIGQRVLGLALGIDGDALETMAAELGTELVIPGPQASTRT
jgi:transcriptional regulator with XRE-family HTH domain